MIVASAVSTPLSVNYHRSLKISTPNQTFKSLKMKTRSVSKRRAAPDTEGLKVAQEVAHEVEETLGVKHLDPVVGDETPEDIPKPEEEIASVWVFAFGSNMERSVLEVRRMIKPAESIAAMAPGYMLTFNQPGLPYREPGFATIEPIPNKNANGTSNGGCNNKSEKSEDEENQEEYRPVHGVAHLMTSTQWEYYKETEGAAGQSDKGYGVVEVEVKTYDGRKFLAFTLMTQPKTIATLKGRKALPSLRYLKLLRNGAAEHKLDAEYQNYLNELVHYEPHGLGGKIGAVLMAVVAFGLLFPAFGLMRFYRKVKGLHSVNKNGFVSKFYAGYFRFVFDLSWVIHELVRPVLGCGVTAKVIKPVGGSN